MMSKQRFAAAFIEAALFADTPEEYEGNGLAIGLATDSAAAMRAFAVSFYTKQHDLIDAYPEGVIQAGHDLWFTTAGHGCGYWEGKDDVSVALDAAAKAALPWNGGLYEGDDGLLHWEVVS